MDPTTFMIESLASKTTLAANFKNLTELKKLSHRIRRSLRYNVVQTLGVAHFFFDKLVDMNYRVNHITTLCVLYLSIKFLHDEKYLLKFFLLDINFYFDRTTKKFLQEECNILRSLKFDLRIDDATLDKIYDIYNARDLIETGECTHAVA